MPSIWPTRTKNYVQKYFLFDAPAIIYNLKKNSFNNRLQGKEKPLKKGKVSSNHNTRKLNTNDHTIHKNFRHKRDATKTI